MGLHFPNASLLDHEGNEIGKITDLDIDLPKSRAPVMIGFDPASPGGDRSCLSIQSADLGEPDMVIVNGRRYVPAEES